MSASALKSVWPHGALLAEKAPVVTFIASATAGMAPALDAKAVAVLKQPLLISRAEAESGSGARADTTVTGSIAVRAAEARLPYQSERR